MEYWFWCLNLTNCSHGRVPCILPVLSPCACCRWIQSFSVCVRKQDGSLELQRKGKVEVWIRHSKTWTLLLLGLCFGTLTLGQRMYVPVLQKELLKQSVLRLPKAYIKMHLSYSGFVLGFCSVFLVRKLEKGWGSIYFHNWEVWLCILHVFPLQNEWFISLVA